MKKHCFALALSGLLAMPALADTIYSNNFEINANGFSGSSSREGTAGYSGYGFGSTYLRNASSGASSILSLNLAQATTATTLSFSLAIIDSWDGLNRNCCGPDSFNVVVDGVSMFSSIFGSYSQNGPVTIGPALTTLYYGQNDLAENSRWSDAAYSVSLSLGALTSGAHTVEFFASGPEWQAGTDESFALDNVQLTGTLDNRGTVPEPGVLALVVLAIGGLVKVRESRKV